MMSCPSNDTEHEYLAEKIACRDVVGADSSVARRTKKKNVRLVACWSFPAFMHHRSSVGPNNPITA